MKCLMRYVHNIKLFMNDIIYYIVYLIDLLGKYKNRSVRTMTKLYMYSFEPTKPSVCDVLLDIKYVELIVVQCVTCITN